MLRFLVSLLAAIYFTPGPDSSLARGSGPAMVATEKIFDFGAVDQWEIIEHDFLVSNQGDRLLRIESVSPD